MLKIRREKPELVAPAGNWSSLMAALTSGADSVYFGVKGLNMRNQASNFELSEITKVMEHIAKNNKKGYLALNVMLMNEQLPKAAKILQEAKKAGVHAVILWDMAAFSMARELGLRIHLSTQASVSNVKALAYYAKQGVRRIVLARECTLRDIHKITQLIDKENIHCEVEAFIHGAMCVSISGRCFLSQYSFQKSANKGECLQPCRRKFFIKDIEGEVDYILGEDYILSPKDLCTLDFFDDLITSGIRAFKIEGRMRSPEYIRVVTSVYRTAIDSCFEGTFTEKLRKDLMQQLYSVYNRGFSRGFYFGEPKDSMSSGLEHTREKIFLGEVMKFFKKINVAQIRLRNGSLETGEDILLVGKSTPGTVATVKELQRDHVFAKRAAKGEVIGVRLPFEVKPKDKVFLWKRRIR